MSCKLEVETSIVASIDKHLPNREEVMSKGKAKSISDYLNNLWNSALTRISQYSGQGGWKVIVNPLSATIEKEYTKQQQAEEEFERDLDFFNNDEALLEQEERDISLSSTSQRGKVDLKIEKRHSC